MNKKTFYISTPIYYPSGKPHVGHAFTTILADVISKYKQLLGYKIFFVTGTDEHGKKIEEAARKNNLDTMAFINNNVNVFINLWDILGINYSKFIRTTDKNHIETVQKIFSEYNKKGLIYLSDWNGMYCVSCEENITPKDIVVEDGIQKCKVGHTITKINESSYFFKMSFFKEWIKKQLTLNPEWVQPQSRVNELLNNFINNDLSDLSISRTSFSWGIPIRENENHVMYVWMDALFNYLTALNFKQKDDSLYQTFWNHNDAEIVHLLSKEITRFHCVYWPIFLHALDVKLPTKIISHGWIVTKTGKMSKSFGNVIDPIQIINEYGRDCLRYYLIKDMSLTNDNIFYVPSMLATYNGDLANNVGNLISRTIGMLNKYNQSIIPELNNNLDKYDMEIVDKIKKTNKEIVTQVQELCPAKILLNVQELINSTNKYIEIKKPWELFKNNETSSLMNLLNLISNVVRISFFWLSPVLVDGTEKAQKQFNVDLKNIKYTDLDNLNMIAKTKINSSEPIYLRKEIPKED